METTLALCFFLGYRFTFYALNMDDTEKIKKALFMFVDLFGLERFDYDTLVRFIITVKKNYRQVNKQSHVIVGIDSSISICFQQVAYHNWAHGFHVANSIYSILKSSPGVFRPLEVSAFCGFVKLYFMLIVIYILQQSHIKCESSSR